MARLAPPTLKTMTDDQRQVHDLIASGPRGQVRGPLAIWLHRPKLAERAQALGAYCRYGSSLSPRLSELAILTMARLWSAEYEWWAHKPPAQAAGLEPEIIEALRTGATPDFDADAEASVLHRVVLELTEQRTLSRPLYDEAVATLGSGRLVDLVGLCGYYTLISMTINAFDIDLPDGAKPDLG